MLGRVVATNADFHILCNAYSLNSAFRNGSHSYLFSIGAGLHGDDIPYTFFNGDTSTKDEGMAVNATDAGIWQDYLTKFVITGDPNVNGSAKWPIYDENGEVLDFSLTERSVIPDVVVKQRCDFWASGEFAPQPGVLELGS
jgi:carboxylesterase type B